MPSQLRLLRAMAHDIGMTATRSQPMGVAIVGCGNIAQPYVADLLSWRQVRLAGLTDLLPARAEALAVEHPDAGLAVYASLDDLLADPSVELVVNLTGHGAHEPVSPVPLLREALPLRWGHGVAEMVDAIRDGRPHRVGGEQAAHVVEIIEAAEASMRTGASIPVESSFPPSEPMDWAR
jgi:predicted dehydrogenase